MKSSPTSSRPLGRQPSESADGPFFGCPLPGIPTSRAKLDRAAAWLRRLEIDWGRLAPYLSFDCAGYLRQTLAIEGAWEIVVCTWLPQQGTPVHGHGDAVGLIRLLAGNLTEAAGGASGCVRSRHIHPGGILREERGVVHQVVNDGRTPAVSLHLYHPPLQQAPGQRARRASFTNSSSVPSGARSRASAARRSTSFAL